MKEIVQIIIDMLETNKDYGVAGIGETLTNWLELNADSLEDLDMENIPNDMTEQQLKLVFEIAPYVDSLTNKLLEMWEEEDE
jgi:hypothetical protein